MFDYNSNKLTTPAVDYEAVSKRTLMQLCHVLRVRHKGGRHVAAKMNTTKAVIEIKQKVRSCAGSTAPAVDRPCHDGGP